MNKIIKFFLIALLSSCSLGLGRDSSSDTPEVRNVLIALSSDYFVHVINGNYGKIKDLILWDDYIPNKNNTISREKYFEQLSKLDGRYEIKDHPLIKVKVDEINIDGNSANISFTKDDSPQIEVGYMWTGSAWLIVDDNLFGDGGVFDNLKKLSKKQRLLPNKIRQKQLRRKDLEVP